MSPVVCPRCGHADTFIEGFLPDTCVCRMCQSQLDWREIPGMGPGCRPAASPAAPEARPGDASTASAPAGASPTPDEGGRENA